MNYLVESVFVGIFTLILYGILQFVPNIPFTIILFIMGVLKHSLGYVLGIQSAYCRMYNKVKTQAVSPQNIEVVVEGIIFIFVGKLFSWFVSNRYIIAFMTGAGIHLMAEWLGIHRYFLKERCKRHKDKK